MAKIFDFKLNTEECLDFAFEATLNGDLKKGLKYIYKALEINPENTEANFYLASIYSDLNAFEFSNDIIYKILPKVKKKDELDKFYILLGANLSALGEYEMATHYASQIDVNSEIFEDIEEVFDIEVIEEEQPKFFLAYPKGEDYYMNLLDIAHAYLKDKKINEAMKILDEFQKDSPLKENAEHLKLICYMMRDDYDAVIYYATEALKKGGKQLAIKCMLITALMFEGKKDEAEKRVNELLLGNYESVDDIGVLLPFLVNLNMHKQVVEYAKKFLTKIKYHPQTLMWLSQAYFNLGMRQDALNTMRLVYTIYRDYLPTEFYIKYFQSDAKSVEYSSSLPFSEILNRQKIVKDFLQMDAKEAKKKLLYDKEFASIIRWIFKEGNSTVIVALIIKMSEFYNAEMDSYFQSILLSDRLTFPVLVEIVRIFILNKGVIKFCCLSNGLFKEVNLTLPSEIKYMPMNFIVAISNVIGDIISKSESKNVDLDLLRYFIQKRLTKVGDKLYFNNLSTDKIEKMKSLKTIAGVIIYALGIDEDDTKNEIINKYDLSKATFSKYYKLLIGDNND